MAKMFRWALYVAAFLLTGGTVSAGASVTVLGLPLGAKMAPTIKVCPSDWEKSKDVCWVGKPYTGKSGYKSGSAHLPNPDSRPGWAAYALFTIGLNKDGELDHLTVRTFDGKEKHIVVNSIASRFGLPTETTPTQDGISSAKWVRDEILIRMLCNEEFCSVEFLSKNAKAQQERDTAKFRAIKAARPVSP